jgi:hypothetical protein
MAEVATLNDDWQLFRHGRILYGPPGPYTLRLAGRGKRAMRALFRGYHELPTCQSQFAVP